MTSLIILKIAKLKKTHTHKLSNTRVPMVLTFRLTNLNFAKSQFAKAKITHFTVV